METKPQETVESLLESWAPFPESAASVAAWSKENVPDRQPSELDSIPKLPSPPQPPASNELSAQENAFRLCRNFFDAEYGSDKEDLEFDELDDGKSYDFFKGLFDEAADLRDLYLRDTAKGDFYCLACRAIGEKLWKKFFGLFAVAQHANSVSKTRNTSVHRGYARAICELLGWTIDPSRGVLFGNNAVDTEHQDELALKLSMENAKEDAIGCS
ncbi:uncharacterized protein LOC110039026 [Phalaenopsis equestris]|uniref:uncharacterized protein LOC110039026 n=1 Tax=Phalaenopsis equestris TaxID=78828 RepID=UPI0009E4DC5C|nr:uncharacterized protein LOC110039026 [Phalaenopsis equestris]